MALVKDGHAVEDAWRLARVAEEITDEAPLFVTAQLWRSERDRLSQRASPLGLRLQSDQSPENFAGDLDRFDAVALEFPKFNDGRAYSYARVLRERLGFRGEVRAVGNVLRDQLLFMQRCGFDAYEVPDAAAWTRAMAEISVFYQPTADGRAPAWRLRRQAGGRS